MRFQLSKAVEAAETASSTSRTVPSGTLSMTSSFAGLWMAISVGACPDVNRPLMKCDFMVNASIE
jgi:hypothetical protein